MALYHKATITPTKAELLAQWVPTQPWCPDATAPVEVIGAYRFDDPEGQVGIETHMVTNGDTLLQVPLTYRSAPLEGAEDFFVMEINHTELGTRWVYDGLGDARFLVMLAGAAMTGQGEALGMVMNEGQWFIAPTNVRIQGGGWSGERVSVDGFAPVGETTEVVMFRNDQFEMVVHRRPASGERPSIGLTATWGEASDPVVLAEVREHS